MGRTFFVAWLIVCATACLVVAFAERSAGWLFGCISFSAVAFYARRQLRREVEVGHTNASGRFVLAATAAMLLVMALLFWVQFKA